MVDFKKALTDPPLTDSQLREAIGLAPYEKTQRRMNHMAEEEAQGPTLDDLDSELLNITSEQWETAGLTQAGKVGFKIISSKLAAAKDKNGVYPRAELEVTINARPDREVTGKGERHWENMRLDGSFIGVFKKLAVAAGIKIAAGSKTPLKEIVAALAGRAAFGTIIHRPWIGRGGEKNISANFGGRFGKSFKELS